MPQPAKVPAYLFLAGSVVCVGVNVGTWIYAANTRPDWSRPVVAVAGVISLLPALVMLKLTSDYIEKVLGAVPTLVLAVVDILAFFSGGFLVTFAFAAIFHTGPPVGALDVLAG